MRTPLALLLAPALVPAVLSLPTAALARPGGAPGPRTAARGPAPAPPAPRDKIALPEEPPGRRLAVGFSRSPLLREALRGRLISAGRYRLDAAPQIPDSPDGLLVGGQVAALREADGFYECRARYFVARQPDRAALAVDHVAASVPLGPLSDGEAALREGRAACLSELAAQIAARLSTF